MKTTRSTGSLFSVQLTACLAVLLRASVCMADVDMTGTWHFGLDFDSFATVSVTQTGNQLHVQFVNPPSSSSASGTIDPMTGDFMITFPFNAPDCGAIFSGQLTGDTFIAPGIVGFTNPDCHSIFCACQDSFPSELRGSRTPCGNGTVDVGETCDDGKLGFSGSCCALGCTPRAAGESCTPDSNVCTDDVCDANAVCTHIAVTDGTSCDDGRFCNGEETTCQTGTCTTGPAPCPLACDEATDQCVTSCPGSPQTCRTAGRSLLSMKLNSDPNKNKLLWKWINGAATSQAEFSDPTTTAEYALCTYNPLYPPLQTIIPADGSTWQAIGTSGYRYKDPSGGVNSITRILLKGGTADRSSIVAKGRGTQLPSISLPTVFPITVQLFNGRTGMCWGADYAVDQMTTNETGHLKAKTP